MPLVIDTDKEQDLEDLQYDIEDTRKTDRWSDAPPEIKDIFHVLEWNIIDGEHAGTNDYIKDLLARGISPRTLIAGPMAAGIAEVGRRFKMDEYFLPEVMMSAKCMQAALGLLKPLIIAEKTEEIGTVVVGTVQGDLHDIGKKIVGMMMEAAGFTVVDLGVSVPPEDFIAALRHNKPPIAGVPTLPSAPSRMERESPNWRFLPRPVSCRLRPASQGSLLPPWVTAFSASPRCFCSAEPFFSRLRLSAGRAIRLRFRSSFRFCCRPACGPMCSPCARLPGSMFTKRFKVEWRRAGSSLVP